MGLGYIMAIMQRGRVSFTRVREILDAKADVVDAPDARSPGQRGELSVRELSYAYESAYTTVLEGRGLTSYLPMPFARKVRVEFVNASDRGTILYFQLDYTLVPTLEYAARIAPDIAYSTDDIDHAMCWGEDEDGRLSRT